MRGRLPRRAGSAVSPRVRKAWMAFFGFWILILSGMLYKVVGSPGILQAMRLQSLLRDREQQVAAMETEVRKLDTEKGRLESNQAIQQREIRRTLGYVASDELLFDFSSQEIGGGFEQPHPETWPKKFRTSARK